MWLLVALSSCSHIEEDERLVYVPMPQAGRCILIEDFTGQDCINCPTATAIVESLQTEYSADTIISVAIHSGPLSVMPTNEKPDGLASELGNTYYNYWQCQYQPVGLIDRSDGLLDKNLWTAKTKWDLQQLATLNILVNADYTDGGDIDIHIQMVSTEGTVEGKLQVWLTEDNIIAFQKMPDGTTNTGYVHNHVLRDAVNGTWGEEVTVSEGMVEERSYTYHPQEGWKTSDLAVVAFVYNEHGVEQVTRKKVVI